MVLLVLSEGLNDLEWGAPFFAQPKTKTNIVRFPSDFKISNKELKLTPYQIPKINVMLLKLEVFQYATYLDLNMVYYHIQLTKDANNLCKIIIPREKPHYKPLPMGVSNSLDILQQETNYLFQAFGFICAYIDKLLL